VYYDHYSHVKTSQPNSSAIFGLLRGCTNFFLLLLSACHFKMRNAPAHTLLHSSTSVPPLSMPWQCCVASFGDLQSFRGSCRSQAAAPADCTQTEVASWDTLIGSQYCSTGVLQGLGYGYDRSKAAREGERFAAATD
jgi:hypothetical protein